MILERYRGKPALINGELLVRIKEVNSRFVVFQEYAKEIPTTWNIDMVCSIAPARAPGLPILNTFGTTLRDALGATIVLSFFMYFFYCLFTFTFYSPFSEFFLVAYSVIFAASCVVAAILNSGDNADKVADYQGRLRFCRSK